MEEKLDKIYDLIGTMYSDVSVKIDVIGKELEEIKQMQKKMDTKVEHKIKPKIQALFEAKDIIYDKLEKLDKIEKRLITSLPR